MTEQEKRRRRREMERRMRARQNFRRHARVSDVCDGGFGGRLSADFFI